MKDFLEKGLDVANKGMDLVNKVYDDGLSKPIQTFGNGLDKCLKFMGAIVYPSMYEYTQWTYVKFLDTFLWTNY